MEFFQQIHLAFMILQANFIVESIYHTGQNCTITNTDNNQIIVNCSGRKLTKIPKWLPEKTCGLDMSYNNIEKLYNESFRTLRNLLWLRMTNCQISILQKEAFVGLSNLKSLYINSNLLRAYDIPQMVLKPLVSLTNLDISDNLFYLDNKFPDISLSFLHKLESLTIDVFGDALYGPTLQNLSKLTTLKLLSLSNQDIILSNKTFTGFSNVSLKYLFISLSFSNSLLKDLQACVFCPLNTLTGLTVLGNEFLHLKMLMRSLYGLQGKDMQYLVFRDLSRHIGTQPVSLTTSDTRYLKTMCVKKLVLANNYILLDFNFTKSLLSLQHKDCIEEIDLNQAVLNYDPSPIIVLLTTFKNLRFLHVCCLKRMHSEKEASAMTRVSKNIYKITQSNIQNILQNYSMITKDKINVYLSPNIEFINASFIESRGTPSPNISIHGGNLKTFDLYDAEFKECTGEINGVSNIVSFNMSGWNCQYLNSRILHNFTSLRYLEFKDSNLGKGLKTDVEGQLFKNLKNLSFLKLSNNGLVTLHSNLFLNQLSSLRYLYLDGNKFTHIPINVAKFSQLEYIDLNNNVINFINETQREQLEELWSRTHKLNINLHGNIIRCSCETLDFLTWLSKTKVTVNGINNTICVDENGRSLNISNFISHMDVFSVRCISKFWLIFSVIGTSLMIAGLILSVVGYRYRYFIEYTCLRVRMFLKRHKPPQEQYEYDAFVAYSSLDSEWVTKDLYRNLKSDFNICLYDKDFVPGKSISDNIINAIDKSRKVIFVVTRHLLESSWGNYEMEMTRMHAFQKGRDNMIIIIIKDNLSIKEMPRVLQTIWWKIVCLSWDDNPSDEELQLFWTKLKNAVSD